jgi:hypothetical protein
VIVFLSLAVLLPALVILVLSTARRVRPDGLKMALLEWTDPDIGPCGRDREAADAGDDLLVANRLTCGSDVGEASAMPAASDPRFMGARPP